MTIRKKIYQSNTSWVDNLLDMIDDFNNYYKDGDITKIK